MKVIVAYVPVIHQGYLQFFTEQTEVTQIYLLGSELKAEFDHLRKDIRALTPEQIQTTLHVLLPSKKINILDLPALQKLAATQAEIIVPDEDIMRTLADRYLSADRVTYAPTFLRWDKKQTLAQEIPLADEVVSHQEFDQKMMRLAYEEAGKSIDWWRQVGAVLLKDSQVLLLAHNHHVPHTQQPYVEGDPRGNFHKGEYIELTTAMHAEAEIICQAAKQGVMTEGCELYVSTFPCPVCAKLVAYSGIKTVFYSKGYSMVNGAAVMKAAGVELVKVGGNYV